MIVYSYNLETKEYIGQSEADYDQPNDTYYYASNATEIEQIRIM